MSDAGAAYLTGLGTCTPFFADSNSFDLPEQLEQGSTLHTPTQGMEPCTLADARLTVGACDTQSLQRPVRFTFDAVVTCVPSNDVLPLDVLVNCGYAPLGSLAATLLISLAGVIFALVVVLDALALRRHAQGHWRLELGLRVPMLCGLALLLFCPLYLASEPSDVSCAARPILLHSGRHLLFAALIVRTLVVYFAKIDGRHNGIGRHARVAPPSNTRVALDRSEPVPSLDETWVATSLLALLTLLNGGLIVAWLLLDPPRASTTAVALPGIANRTVERPGCFVGNPSAVGLAVILDVLLVAGGLALRLRLRRSALQPSVASLRPYDVGASQLGHVCVLLCLTCLMSYAVLASPDDAWGWWWPVSLLAAATALVDGHTFTLEARVQAQRAAAEWERRLSHAELSEMQEAYAELALRHAEPTAQPKAPQLPPPKRGATRYDLAERTNHRYADVAAATTTAVEDEGNALDAVDAIAFAAAEELELPAALQCRGGSYSTEVPGERIRECLEGLDAAAADPAHTRIVHLEAMAGRMRDPTYSLRLYYDDLLRTFPELRLYLAEERPAAANAKAGADAPPNAADSGTLSGRSQEVEYQRTIGALFNVYWLMRLALPSVPGSLALDGQLGFCFGVQSGSWAPPPPEWVARQEPPHKKPMAELSADQKRHRLWSSCEWAKLHELVVDAGLLRAAPGGNGAVEVDVGRTMAMLSLMAVHDVMKMELLLPRVAAAHAPFAGVYDAGALIYDHDLALGYLLRHDVHALPCVGLLSPAQQHPIIFTQAKLGFNHGWLVQAEAPPGALFAQAKATIEQEGASSADLAFYFVHWLTDLGGAEPTPLRGAEKFTLRFPHAVLHKFISSFNVVQQLATTPPTELMQSYLVQSWPSELLGVPAPQTSASAIALMRLIVQAQRPEAQSALLSAYRRLNIADKLLLELEMSLSGVPGAAYSLAPEHVGGPAFLIYYSPAFLQSLAVENALVALLVLADIYRAARKLWPLETTAEAQGRSVIIHIGAIKGLSSYKLTNAHARGHCWRLVQKGANDAIVEMTPLVELPQQGRPGQPKCEVLPLWAEGWHERGAMLPWWVTEEVATPDPAPIPAPRRDAAVSGDASLTLEAHEKMLGPVQKRNVARDMQHTGWVIDPLKSRWIQLWDLTMLIPLIFTALVTPVEIAFLPEGRHITILWLVNRSVDAMFMVDIALSFNVAYQESADNGGHWVFNKQVIAWHYTKTWFVVDVISVCPFWLLTFDFDDPMGRNGGGGASGAATLARGAVLFRVVKLLRMLKLARILKAARVMQRVALDIVSNQWEWTFAKLKMAKLMLMLAIVAHWQCCLYGLVSSYMKQEGYPNWIDAFEADFEATFDRMPNSLDTFSASLYWSVMTLTSIGYGEILPVNTVERLICAGYMMFSGAVWTYAIGEFAAIATTLDPNSVMYENTMDSLNYFMRERRLPRTMRMALRDYFNAARCVHQLNDDATLLDKMSPLLQGAVALAANKQWIDHVWYFRGMAGHIAGEGGREAFSDFVAELAKHLVVRPYVSHERLPVGQLYILRKGLVVKMWRFLNSGKVWGEDIILDTTELIDHSQAVALTYVECFTLRRARLDEVLVKYPPAQRHVHKAMVRITLQRALLKHMCQTFLRRPPGSFVPRSSARGFQSVPNKLSMDQKIDVIFERCSASGGGSDDSFKSSNGADHGAAAKPLSAGRRWAPVLRAASTAAPAAMSLAQAEDLAAVKRDVTELKAMMQQVLQAMQQDSAAALRSHDSCEPE